VFAATLSEAFIGCVALCESMKNLHSGGCYKQCVVPHRVDEGYSAPLGARASAADQPHASRTWYEAEQIIAEREQPCFSNKRKRHATVTMYLVRWRGSPCPADSWEPKANVNDELYFQWANSRGESTGRVAAPSLILSDGAPAARVSMFSYRSQDVGFSVDVVLFGCAHGHIYGDRIYTDDSDVATAALHAGVLQLGETKLVKVFVTGPIRRFSKSLRNGIQSNFFTYFPGSFTFDESAMQDVRSCSKNRSDAKSNKKTRVQLAEEQPAVASDDELVLLCK
jgi:hypothetical protein